jgi:polysaccharide export outer membrane protein
MKNLLLPTVAIVAICVGLFESAAAAQSARAEGAAAIGGSPTATTALPADYVIGAEDVLSVVFWREKDMSADVVVRPDGKISLPLLKDVQAAGYTPEQLTGVLVSAASKYVSQPNATVIVKEINSRKVFIVGQVAKPGGYPMTGNMTVLELIALSGDVLEFAKSKNMVVVRKQNDSEQRFKFNYKDVLKGKDIQQNILLKPGDTIIVP